MKTEWMGKNGWQGIKGWIYDKDLDFLNHLNAGMAKLSRRIAFRTL